MKNNTTGFEVSSGMHIDWLPSETVNSKISTLSELFTEWFLYESDKINTIESFIADRGLSDALTPSDFTKIICGDAYLSDCLVSLIYILLPFKINEGKLYYINAHAHKIGAQEIQPKPEIVYKKIKEISQKQAHERAENTRKRKKTYRHEYYIANIEFIKNQLREYRQKHATQIAEYKKHYYEQNRDTLSEYHKQYRKDNAEHISARKKKCYHAKKAQYLAHNAEYYAKNHDTVLAQQHEYYTQNSDAILSRQRNKYRENKERDKKAKTVCPTYLALLQMRHDRRGEYLKILGQRNLISFAIKECSALQSMDSEKCVFCNNTCSAQNCAMLKIADIPNDVLTQIPGFVAIIKQKSKVH